MYKRFRTFLEFLYRDAYIYSKRMPTLFINNGIIYPIIFAFACCYLQTNIFFGPGQEKIGSIAFIGHVIIIIFVLAFLIASPLIYDIEGARNIDYQITILSPRLILLERILFASLLTFALSIPFFPVAKLLLGSNFTTENCNWPLLYLMLYVSALCSSAYHHFVLCAIKSYRVMRSYWMRTNVLMITLGGIFIPWFIIKKFSPILGKLIFINPLIYITEGLRQSIIGGEEFLPIWICLAALLTFTAIFTLLGFHFFKKKLDHI